MSFKYVKCLSINFLSILANNLNFIKKNSIITSVRKMKSVKRNETTLIIKNSKFISLIDKVKNEEEVNTLLKEAKHKYPNATHYCYAYIIDTINHDVSISDLLNPYQRIKDFIAEYKAEQ